MSVRRSWIVEQHVRADAPSIFVPAEQLAGARSGDSVEVQAPGDTATTRLGRISERVADNAGGQFFIVELDDAHRDTPSSGDA
jgi:hypothetical protein